MRDIKEFYQIYPGEPYPAEVSPRAQELFTQSTKHRVQNPTGAAARSARLSMLLFLHPHTAVKLSETHTAETYLKERLRELGHL